LKLLVEFYRQGQKALKDGASLADIRAMPVIATLLKARMEIPDDQIAKLDQIETTITDEFKRIGVKVTN
jgi:V/A-type H+-transporting ATPase subunit A